MPAPAEIIQLRKILAERFPPGILPASTFLSTGIASIDQLLGGGLRRGTVAQIVVPHPSGGSALLLHDIIHTMQHRFVALIDGKNSFEPLTETPFLLWLRCQNVIQATRAADLLIRDGNFALTILDLKQNAPRELRKIPATTWYRLQRVAEETRAILLLLTRYYISGSSYVALQITQHLQMKNLSEISSAVSESLPIEFLYRKTFGEANYASA
jgi:RecA/RadA recombinase